MNVGEFEPRIVQKGVEETTLPIPEGETYWVVQIGHSDQLDVMTQFEAELLSRIVKLEIMMKRLKNG